WYRVHSEPERVDHEIHRRAFWDDPLALRDVLLERVVLDGAPEHVQRIPALLGRTEVHRPHDRGRTVDRHRRRDLVHWDPIEEDLHVAHRRNGDTLAADLTTGKRIVRVTSHERGHVERGRETGHAMLQQIVEARVGV